MKKQFLILQISVIAVITLFTVIFLPGCASLSKSQMGTVASFSNSCDSFAKYPSILFTEMAKIRADRGCFYTASLSDPLLRIKELNSLSKALAADLELAKKMDISLEILVSYQRVLKSLSHTDRYNNTGREFRSLGRNLDSLINRYNLIDISDPLPLGVGKALGRIVGYGAELWVRSVQTKAVREYVVAGDSLVGAVSADIVKILSSKSVGELIDNEAKGLDANYLSYLKSGEGSRNVGGNNFSGRDFSGDREYLMLLDRVNKLSVIRSSCVSAAKALAKAHGKIATEVVKRKKIKELYPEIEKLDDELYALRLAVKKMNL
ncbi:MAG: hypothetical protein A2X18_03130 [Bacteroidetes bacterium GWF2_40_14]|nr:MAG: hypothetical protein A2X18_03130 [Bacteroidetes bacterium GWF2_40_14]